MGLSDIMKQSWCKRTRRTKKITYQCMWRQESFSPYQEKAQRPRTEKGGASLQLCWQPAPTKIFFSAKKQRKDHKITKKAQRSLCQKGKQKVRRKTGRAWCALRTHERPWRDVSHVNNGRMTNPQVEQTSPISFVMYVKNCSHPFTISSSISLFKAKDKNSIMLFVSYLPRFRNSVVFRIASTVRYHVF